MFTKKRKAKIDWWRVVEGFRLKEKSHSPREINTTYLSSITPLSARGGAS